MSIGVINCGSNNIASIHNIIQYLGYTATTVNHAHDIQKHSKIIIPGIGKFDSAMKNLKHNGYIDELELFRSNSSNLILGICLGMQLFTKGSEEGNQTGFGWFDATTKKFGKGKVIKNIGWREIKVCKENKILPHNNEIKEFYFVHGYHVVCNNKDDILCESIFESKFICGIHNANVYGVQFHPEKSHKFGCQLFKSFLTI